MRGFYLIFFIFFVITESGASTKENIIQNFKKIENISFNFEQNINDKVEKGNCTIKYPKKIYCEYNLGNQKILVSNGKSLVIKSKKSYYLYPLKKTPLNFLLDKEFLINKIKNLEERIIDDKFINFKFIENDNEINIFFDKENYNLVGWQTLDIYQNLSITFIYNVVKNQNLNKSLFYLPSQS
tara:strand:- start:1129 stop:1677 length:549 start_codon:yes stop_codon:yes gene_type:complete